MIDKYYNQKERAIKLNKKIEKLKEVLLHCPRIYLVKNCLPENCKRYRNILLQYDSSASERYGNDIISVIIETELELLFLKNYKLNIFAKYNSNYMKECFIEDIWIQTKQKFLEKISELSQNRNLQEVIRKKLDYIGREDGEWYKEFKYNIQFITRVAYSNSENEKKWKKFMDWWKGYRPPYGHNLN